MHIRYCLALTALAFGNVLASTGKHQTVSDINAMIEQTQIVKRAIESFNGGFGSGLKVANAIYNAHTTAEIARNNLGTSDPLSGEDGERTMDAWNELYPVLVSTLQAGQQKAPEVKRAGFAYVTQGMINNLYNEKNRFEEAMHGQLASNHSRMLRPSQSHIDSEFKKALDALQS